MERHGNIVQCVMSSIHEFSVPVLATLFHSHAGDNMHTTTPPHLANNRLCTGPALSQVPLLVLYLLDAVVLVMAGNAELAS